MTNTFGDRIKKIMAQRDPLQEKLEILEAEIEAVKEMLNKVDTQDIPALFHEFGIKNTVTLDDGTEWTLKQFLSVSQTDQTIDWLLENGYGIIIKDNLSFEKGALRPEDLNLLAGRYKFTRQSVVHPQTLKKCLTEHLESGGIEPPESAMKISRFEKATIKE